jgi:hypothetical protein
MSTDADHNPGAVTLSRFARGAALIALSVAVLAGSLMAVRAIGGSGASAAPSSAIAPATTPGNEALVLPEVKRLAVQPRVVAKPVAKRRAAASRSTSAATSSAPTPATGAAPAPAPAPVTPTPTSKPAAAKPSTPKPAPAEHHVVVTE